MAPRSEGDHRNARGMGHRPVLYANTGAGISTNSRRSTGYMGRNGRHAGNRRARVPGHATTPRPAIAPRPATVPRVLNDRVVEKPRRSVNGNHIASRGHQVLSADITTDAVNPELSTGTADRPPVTPVGRPQANSSPIRQPTSFSGSTLTRITPESQRRLDPISPPGRMPFTSYTMWPNPIRMINRPRGLVDDDDVPVSPTRLPTTSVTTRGSPTKRPTIYRGNDPIKRRVSNPRLRAVLAGNRVPTPRQKSAEERPVLKMGISKEYKGL
jgi:hypothetical protein